MSKDHEDALEDFNNLLPDFFVRNHEDLIHRMLTPLNEDEIEKLKQKDFEAKSLSVATHGDIYKFIYNVAIMDIARDYWLVKK